MYSNFFSPIHLFLAREKKQLEFLPAISLQNDVNTQDWYTGFSFGMDEQRYEWSAKLGMTFRPFRKASVIEDQETGVFRQYLERKFYIFLDLEKDLFISKSVNQN